MLVGDSGLMSVSDIGCLISCYEQYEKIIYKYNILYLRQ